jgi:D-sedoheptulose 7-phosphate isomerase
LGLRVSDFRALFSREVAAHRDALDAVERQLGADLAAVLDVWERGIRGGGKILFFGNGGSAADAQHIAAELVVRYLADRPAIAAVALTTDTSVLTAAGNDLGFESLFARQIEALGRAGDVAVGISTSGRSPNVLRGLDAARAAGLATVGMTGGNSSVLRDHCDVVLAVPSTSTARIQEMHILLGHVLCAGIESRLRLTTG